MNRYSYVLGNPLRYTDPTGHAQREEQYRSDAIGEPISLWELKHISRQTAVGYLTTYIARNLESAPGASVPAAGVTVRYDGQGPDGVQAANNPSGPNDAYISMYESAFTEKFVASTSDVIGVLYPELEHSQQEAWIERNKQKPGTNIWIADPIAGSEKPNYYGIGPTGEMHTTSGGRFIADMEYDAHSAVLSLPLNFSSEFRALQTKYVDGWRQAKIDYKNYYCADYKKCGG